jgi:hypothetical protein
MRRTVAAAVVALAVGAGAPAEAKIGPGCDKNRPTWVHEAGGAEVKRAPSVVPCGTETGFYTGETGIQVTPAGTVWFSAADWEWALARSDDGGDSFSRFRVPGPQAFPGCGIGTTAVTPCGTSQQEKYNTVGDAYIMVDRDTGRTFWSKTYGYAACSSLNFSDDGEIWEAVTRFACPGGDYGKMAAGPPPADGAKPVGYPNVVYECVNMPAPTFVVGPARGCYVSLDGGNTWNFGGAPSAPSPLAPGCLHFQEPPVVGRDGTVYQPLGCANNVVMVAMSDDETQTWTYASVPTGDSGATTGVIGGTGVSAAVDDAGNLYVIWPGEGRKVYLAISKDKGATWSAPLMVSAPGVTPASPPAQITAREPGHIAIAYYGHPTGADGTKRNGYLTESRNAAAAQPVFESAQLNDTDAPLYFPTDGGTLPRNDYLGVTIGPDGTPWTALVKLRTTKSDAEGFIQSTGFAGRLETLPPR